MYRGNDILKTYDKDLNYIGRATREKVHTEGLLHQVAHVWMFQPDGPKTCVIFQKRSTKREIFPGKYDLLQTTHFDPEESYEEGIMNSLDYYMGTRPDRSAIKHIGSISQRFDQGDYHDNALVQVFVIDIKKVLFLMPDTEEIIKVYYEDLIPFATGKTDEIQIYSLDDYPIKKSHRSEWWLREEEYEEVIAPYVAGKIMEYQNSLN